MSIRLNKIIREFGEETISIFKFEPEKLSKIKGITKEKAILMGAEFCAESRRAGGYRSSLPKKHAVAQGEAAA